MLVFSASAGAEVRRTTVTDEFGPDGTSASSFPGTVSQIDFDEANDHLLVMTEEPREIFTFDVQSPQAFEPVAGGHFPVGGSETAGMAVSPLTGDVYVASLTGGLFGFTPSGTPLPNFPINGFPLSGSFPSPGEVCGVSVNSEGDLFVYERTYGHIEVLDPEGRFLSRVHSGECSIQLDRVNDDIYFSGPSVPLTRLLYREEYSGLGITLGGPPANDLAVDPVTRRVLMSTNPSFNGAHELREYSREAYYGEALNTMNFGSPVGGIAAGPTGTAYLGIGHKVAEIPLAAIPVAETGEPLGASEVGGDVDPDANGPITTCYFQWGESSDYTQSTNKTPCAQATPISSAQPVTADLPGLTPGQTYHYRVVAGNANNGGFAYGQDETISPPVVSELQTEAADAITRNSATLHGSFTGNGSSASYYFEWGQNQFFLANKAPESPGSAGSPSGHTPLSVDLSGLQPQTTYYYRVVATDSAGTSEGLVRSFKTQSFVLDTTTKPPTGLSQEGVTLNGEFTGSGEPVHYDFEWGPTSSYGHVIPAVLADAGTPSGPTPVSEVLTEFEGSSTYHYRLVAISPLGTSYGEDETFTALPAPLPSISNTQVFAVTAGSATVGADIAPERKATVYLFEYGPTTTYGATSREMGPIPGVPGEPQTVQVGISNLTPNTLYHYRAVATNFTGTAYGPDETFLTPGPPTIGLISVSPVGSDTASVSAEIAPDLRDTTVHFEYGLTSSYGSRTPESSSIGSDEGRHSVSATLTGLTPGTTYHVRAIATNEVGVTASPDQKFTMPASPAPTPATQPSKCKHGFVRRKGRCVKRHHRRHRHRRGHPRSRGRRSEK